MEKIIIKGTYTLIITTLNIYVLEKKIKITCKNGGDMLWMFFKTNFDDTLSLN